MEQKERKKHERPESASSSRRNGFSNCFSCRSYSSNTSFVLLVLLSVQNFPTESFIAHIADLSALNLIHAVPECSTKSTNEEKVALLLSCANKEETQIGMVNTLCPSRPGCTRLEMNSSTTKGFS